jgi:hypothetical protein
MGVVLYEALTGRLPFNNEHVGDLIIQIVTANVPSVHELMPSVPKPISDVVAKAMARDREARFTDAAEMQQALHDALAEVFPDMPRVTLSEQPPGTREASSGTLPRISLERLRTLEFPLEGTGSDMSREAVRSPNATPGAAGISIDVEVLSGPPPRPSRWLKPAVAAAALALVAGVLFTRAPAPPDDGVRVTQLSSEREAQVAAARPLPTTTTVELHSLPESALVEVDGVKVRGPRLELPRDERSHAIRVTVAGMAPWHVTHVATADGAYDVVLSPITTEVTELDAKPMAGARVPAPSPIGSSVRRKHPPARRPPADAQQKPPSALKQLDF